VLSSVSADEFWLAVRIRGGPTVSGLISREGLDKLWKHPDVTRIYLQELRQPAVIRGK
jgi:hypothetical protein